MQMAELNSEYLGISQQQLMECAGYGTALQIIQHINKQKLDKKIVVVSGPGRNGGDGFATARHLAAAGYQVRVVLVGRETDIHDQSARNQLNAVKSMTDTIQFESIADSALLRPFKGGAIVDAIVGTGIKGELHQPLLGAVRMINRSEGFKVAVDLPSGLDGDSGEPHGDAVKADLTVCLHKKKQGLDRSHDYVGELVILPIGIPAEAETYAGPGDYKVLWKPRPFNSRKGDFGRLLVIGGSENFTGAPAYAALAASKMGTDLVYVASPEQTANIIASYSPDLITIKLQGQHVNMRAMETLEPWVKKSDAIIIGPGIGLHEETAEAVWKLISLVESQMKPLVLDADALKVYGRRRRKFKTPTVLTPHAGEFAAITQRKVSEDIQVREESAAQLAKEVEATVILKGAIDIIADPVHVKRARSGTPFMTVGGTGDALTGMVGSLLAQHVEPFQASTAAAFLNGLAGELLIRDGAPTITTSHLVEYVQEAMKYCIQGPPYPSTRTGSMTNKSA